MQFKKNLMLNLFLLLFQGNILRTIPAVSFIDKKDRTIVVREIRQNEFEAVRDISLRTFGKIYNFTSTEQMQKLKKSMDSIFDEEINYFQNNKNILALVVTFKEKIIGYISLNSTDVQNVVYGRFLVIDIDFHNSGICKNLFKYCRQIFPEAKKIICLTNKINSISQRFYFSLGGKKIEQPYWINYLYKTLNKTNFVGYEFNEEALTKFD